MEKLITFLCILSLVYVAHGFPYYDAGNASAIEDALFTTYHVNVRPQLHVTIQGLLAMYQLNYLDIVDQTCSITGFIVVVWTDTRLVWNTASYGNIDECHVPPSRLWTPPLVLLNTVGSLNVLGDNSDLANIPVVIRNDGTVNWWHPVNFVAGCSVDITYFPFDKQICYFRVGVWKYNVNVLSMETLQDDILLASYNENGEWAIDKTTAETDTASINSLSWATLKFTVYASRKYQFYVINLLLPVLFLNFLGVLVHTLPEESGEKIGYTLTILLSLSVVMTLVSDKIPSTSTHVSILSVYLLWSFIMSSIEAVVTVFVMKLNLFEERGYAMTPQMQKFAKKVLAPLSRWKKTNEVEPLTSGEEKKQNPGGPEGEKSVGWAEEKERTPEEIEYTYKEMGSMLDRIFFVMCGMLIVIGSITFMLVLQLGATY